MKTTMIEVELGIGLADHTWYEKTVKFEFDVENNGWEDIIEQSAVCELELQGFNESNVAFYKMLSWNTVETLVDDTPPAPTWDVGKVFFASDDVFDIAERLDKRKKT